jgi:hypothetical protein
MWKVKTPVLNAKHAGVYGTRSLVSRRNVIARKSAKTCRTKKKSILAGNAIKDAVRDSV